MKDQLKSYDSIVVKEGDRIGVVVSKTPFFPKRGGQECDTGVITFKDFTLEVDEVIEPIEGLIVHWGIVHIKGGNNAL